MQEDNLSDITLTPRIPTVEDNPFIPMAQKMAQPDQLGLNAPEDNPFLAIAKGMGGTSQPPAIGSIASTLSINPDQAAQASKLGGQFGLGQDIALRNMDELRRRSLITRLQQTGMLDKNPALAESLANPAFSAQAHDDIDNLAETGSWIDSIYKGFEGGFLMQEMGELRFSPLSGERFYGATAAQQERIEQVRKRMQETQGSGVLYMTAQVIAQQLAQAKGIGTAALTGFGIGGATGGAPGAVAGGGVGAATGIVLTTAQMEAGLLYDELEQAGVDPETATTAAVIGGTINGAIELLGAKIAAAPFRPLIRKLIADRVEALAMPTMRSAIRQGVKGYGIQVGTETLEETVQEITAMATSEIAKAADGIDSELTWTDALTRITDAAIGGFQGSLLLGGIGPGANAIVDVRRAKQTEAQQKWLDGLQERVVESKVRERNPNAFQEFVEKQVEGKPVATIYVDAEEAKGVLAQLNLTVSQVDAIVPGFAEQVRTEAERGGDVTIPTAVFSAKLANTDLGNALRPHMRLSPEALSVTQLEAVRAERERMSAAGQDVIDERLAAEDTAFVESATRVEETMYSELTAAGQPATEAKINAEFVRNMMASLADRVGVTPEQMFERYPYRVRGEGQAEQAQALEQAARMTLVDVEKAFMDLGVEERLTETDVAIRPGIIRVPENLRSQGRATNAMQRLIEYADQAGKRIDVSPTAEFGANKRRLVEWYKRLGFVENKGRNKDFAISATMYRVPQPAATDIMEQASRIDADYMAAVESGDMETAQSMVDEAAKSAGYKVGPVYHGTKRRFEKFESKRDAAGLIYFSEDREFAARWPVGFGGHRDPEPDVVARIDAARKASRELTTPLFEKLETEYGSWKKVPDDRATDILEQGRAFERTLLDGMTVSEAQSEMGIRVITAYLNADRVFDPSTQANEFVAEVAKMFGVSEDGLTPDMKKLMNDGAYLIWENPVVVNAVLDKYDAIRLQETSGQPARTIAVRDNWRIKSADPVTYDESGNVIPLSRRFNLASPMVFEQRPVTPGFYSALEREVAAIDAKALTAAGWGERLKGLVNKGAIKSDELEWSGLNDYLQMQEGKVSKDTVLEFLRGNGVKVEVIRLGDRQQAVDQAAIAGSFVAEDDLRKSDEGLSPEVEAAFNTYRTLIETGASREDIAQQMFIIDDALNNAFGTDLNEYIASEYEARPDTRFQEYTLPGGTNYREVLLKLPVSEPQIVVSNNLSVAGEKEVYHLSFSEIGREGPTSFVVEQSDGSWKAEYLDEFTLRDTKESAISWARARMQPSAPRLKALAGVSSTHWQERNVLVHLRMNDRVDSDGKRVLFVEEVQSDWGQAGVKRGFVNQRAADMAELDNLFAQQEANPTDARKKQIARVRDRIYKNEYNVLRGPYVETTDGWLNLGLKQIMLESVTGNYDRVAFVNGEQSADRYSLTKQVERLSWRNTYLFGATKLVTISPKQGNLVELPLNDSGVVVNTGGQFDGKALDEIVPKEIADQIMGSRNGELAGEQLEIGGKGMQDFYDKIVPAAMNKLLKKYGGGKVGTVEIDIRTPESEAYYAEPTDADILPQPGFDITPAMVEKLATGLPLFQAARGQARGGFDPQKLLTTLNKDADFSTFAHETAHYFLTILGDVAARPDAPASVLDDMNTLLRWFGVKDLATWNAMSLDQQRQYHEQFAYSFETYLFEGKAPSVEMQGLFDQFARWLKQVYQGLITKINDVYKAEFGKDLPILTGEVRQVMDRMLATEDQIARAQAIREMKPQFQTQEQSRMDDATWAAYQELQEQATERAVAELTTATLKEMAWMSRARGRKLRELQRQHDDKRKEIKDEVAEDLRILPVYRAMEFLKRGKVVDVDGTTKPATGQFKLSAAGVQAVMPPGFDVATLGRGRYGMVNEDGLHPDLIAPLYGYASGAELVTALSTAKPFADAVAERTDQRMLSEFSELADPAARSLAVDRAIHNEARARLIAVEQRWAAKLQQPVSVIMEAASQVAGEIIGRQTIRTLSPRAYAAAEARAARLATLAYSEPQSPEQAGQTAATRAYNAAIAAGKTVDEATAESLSAGVAAVETARQRRADFDAKYGGKSPAEVMMRAKRQQLLQNMLARQALEARAEIDRARSAFKRFFGSDEKIAKTRNMEMVSAARAILGWYGFGKRDKSPAEYVDQLRAYNPAAYAQLEPLILRAAKGPQDYRDLTVDEFRVLRDTVDGLWIQARKDKQVKLADRTMALDEVVGELDQRLEEIGVPKVVPGEKRAPTFRDRAARNLMTLRSTMRRVESWADAMDGVSTVRPFTNYLVRPVLDAVDKFTASRNKYMKRFRDLVVNLQMPEGTIAAPELDYTFGAGNAGIGKAELLGALLHTGNASNYRKLLLGRGWGQEDEFGNLDDTQFKAFVKRMQDEGVLTKADYDFLQSVWDLNEDIKPIAQKAHYELYGFYFTEIPASEVVTPFGTYRGGYVPAATDKFMVADAAQRAGEEELESDWRNSLPSTGRGFTQTRMAGYNKALSLDVRVIGAHIDSALRFSMIQPAITQALRILRSREFASRLDRVDPTVKQELLIPWLNRTARQLVSQPGKYKGVDTFWRGVRNRTGMSIMFANLRNAMQQPTGLFVAAVKVQPRYLMSALTEYVGSPQRTANSVAALSPFMEDRLKGQLFEVQEQINEVLLNPSRFDKAKAWTDRHGYFLQQAFQNMVDVVTWVGAYNQSLSTTDTTVTAEEAQREAIAAGDAAVRLTQGSVRPSDVSAFESGTPFFRSLTHFTGYFNMLANLNATEYVKVIRDMGFRGNKGKLVYIYMMGFMLPAVVADAIVRTLGGGWEDEDEDGYLDVFMDWFFGSQIRQGVAFVPFGTTAYTLATTAFDDKPYNDRMTTSPSVVALEASTVGVGKAAIALVDEETDVTGKNVRDVLTFLSMATGIPFSVIGRPAGYLVDVQRGEVEPTSTYDMIRGTITGTATPESKR
jgi:GNAT superfamily N-acetyltransferase